MLKLHRVPVVSNAATNTLADADSASRWDLRAFALVVIAFRCRRTCGDAHFLHRLNGQTIEAFGKGWLFIKRRYSSADINPLTYFDKPPLFDETKQAAANLIVLAEIPKVLTQHDSIALAINARANLGE
ncbi:MAG: hypothetical protein A3K90_03725 [Pelodictyon luteolum]|uniref:Uncharacterized protein n=1 Tax=Pelodictyon luteolum TaxID=1100 RepID=A0A165LSK4_PELLU|nr:MAG: hypothetical protein A3K90_03725 [Pelodictyon luteolum]